MSSGGCALEKGIDTPGIRFGNPWGFSHNAPQKIFGYIDAWDVLSRIIGFNIDGTRLNMGDYTLRLWTGTYWPFDPGAEFAFYGKNNRAATPYDLMQMGIVSTKIEVRRRSDNSLVTNYDEKQISFWTTVFSPFTNVGKSDLYSVNTIIFENDEKAQIFSHQLGTAIQDYKGYFMDGKRSMIPQNDGNSVSLTWGKP